MTKLKKPECDKLKKLKCDKTHKLLNFGTQNNNKKKISNQGKDYLKVCKYTTNIQERFKTNLYLDCQDCLQSCNSLVMP